MTVRSSRAFAVLLMAGASLAACATPRPHLSNRLPKVTPAQQATGAGGVYKLGEPYQVAGVWYVPKAEPNYDQIGIASWYGDDFNQKPTANGEIFDMGAISGAHTTLPLPSIVEVTNLENGRSLMVRVNDRGPFVGGRIIDLSHAAARELGYDQQGVAKVRVRYVGPAALPDASLRYAANSPRPTAQPSALRAPRFETRVQAAAQRLPDLPPPAAADAPIPTVRLASAAPRVAAPVSAAPLGPVQAIPVQTAAAQATPRLAVSAPAVAPQTVAISTPAPSMPIQLAARMPAPAVSAPQAAVAATAAFRVQAGAFSDPANAQRVAATLGQAGHAVIEPIERNGATLYRVLVVGSADEGEALALRERVAQLGFADARVIRPY